MDAKLSVEVGAKIDDLTSKMLQAEKSVTNFADKSGRKLDQYAKSGGQSLQNFAKGSNKAAFALNNLGRVAQDAPFGFIGIQNNLNPLLESFQRLRKESGSNAAALKALGSTLLGPAGVGVALSLVTAGIVLYTQWQQKSAKATENASKADEDYAKSLDDVSQAQLVGAEKAQDELVTLKLLYDRTQDLTLSSKERNKAADELQKLYPALLGNFSNEAILAGKAAAQYDILRDAILATSRAQAARDLISKNQQKILENESKVAELEKDRLENQAKAIKLAKSIGSGLGQGFGGSQNTSIAIQNANAQSKVNDVIELQNKIKADNNRLNENNLLLIKEVTAEIAKGGQLTGKVGAKERNDQDQIAELTRQLKEAREQFYLTLVEAKQKLGELRDEGIQNLVPKSEQDIDKLIKKNYELYDAQIKASQVPAPKGLNEALATSLKLLDQNKMIGLAIGDVFGNVAEAIGTALASGTNVFEAFGNAVLSSIGDILVQFGKLTLAAGIASTALGKALSNPINPASGIAAIAAGVALIAIGSAVKGFSGSHGGGSNQSGGTTHKKIPGFADGVQNFRGGIALVGERGPELLQLPTGSNVIPNHKIGGMSRGGDTISANLGISMREFVLEIRREEKLIGRIG